MHTMKTYPLFLFGECLEAVFLSQFPKPIPTGQPHSIDGYEIHYTKNGRAFLSSCPGGRVSGLLCDADEFLLWALDQWKGVPSLQRTTIQAPDECYIYLANAAENHGTRAPAEQDLTQELAYFIRLYQGNELGRCDVHLMFPCSFESFHLPMDHPQADPITAHLASQIQIANNDEFSGEYLTLQRGALGVHSFGMGFSEEDRTHNTQPGLIHYSIHETTKIGTVSVVFPYTLVSALHILNVCCSNVLTIVTDNTYMDFCTWLKSEYGIILRGMPRALLFAFDPLSKAQLMRCLAMERFPCAELIGPTLSTYAEDNFAQYDIAEVYASNKCLIEISKYCEQSLIPRFSAESVEIFFMELLSMQSASIHRICSRVLSYMQQSNNTYGQKDYDHLIALSQEMSSVVLFFDYNQFRYPTVTIACKRISQRFGMDEEIEKYYKYREILEQVINLAHEQREKIESSNMNLLLLILAIVQVLPTFVETFQMCIERTWSLSVGLSWIYSILSCCVLCGLFSWYKRRQIRRTRKTKKEY